MSHPCAPPIRFSFDSFFPYHLKRLPFAWASFNEFLLLLNQKPLQGGHCSSGVNLLLLSSLSLVNFSKKIEALSPEVHPFSTVFHTSFALSQRHSTWFFLKSTIINLSTFMKDVFLLLYVFYLLYFLILFCFLLHELAEIDLFLFFFYSFGTYTYCFYSFSEFSQTSIFNLHFFPLSKLKVNHSLLFSSQKL